MTIIVGEADTVVEDATKPVLCHVRDELWLLLWSTPSRYRQAILRAAADLPPVEAAQRYIDRWSGRAEGADRSRPPHD